MPNKKKAAQTKRGRLRSKKVIADVAKVLKAQKKLEPELAKVKKQLDKWFDDPFFYL
jgi:hypothetical protein